MTQIAIKAVALSKIVKTKQGPLSILHDVNLCIQEGETVALVGTSGSGKTTLLSILAGLDETSSGEVFLLGHNLSIVKEDERARIRRENVGFVFQTFQLIPELTALENVALPLEIKGIDRSSAIRDAQHWLNQVGLAHRHEHFPRTLSGGEQQRVALARAFVTKPKILFADEPTGSLDEENGEKVIDLLFKLNKELNCTLILVTHDPDLAKKCQKIFNLRGGVLKAAE